MLVLPLALRALRWRAGASAGVFVVALVAVLAATIGPIYLHAVGEAVLAERLSQASQYQRDTFVSRSTLLDIPGAGWEHDVRTVAEQAYDPRFYAPPVYAEKAQVFYAGTQPFSTLASLSARVAARLSGGEQQRVAIAAAVCAGARLLLVDEPTSQLDAAGRDAVVGLLEQVNRDLGATVVVVTHDPSVAVRSARTVTIRDGRVGAEGRHGREFAVIGRDGALQLPPEVLEAYPPGTLLEVQHHADGVNLLAHRDHPPPD